MSDLTQLNAISGKDVKATQMKQAIIGVTCVASTDFAGRDQSDLNFGFSGNMLGNMERELRETSRLYDWIRPNGQYTNPDQFLNNKAILEEQKEIYGRFLSIYQSIKRQ